MKRTIWGLTAGVMLAATLVAPASAAPAPPQQQAADTQAELAGRAELIDILMEDHMGRGKSGTPRSGFGTPRKLSEGFPVVAERTYCDDQRVDVPPSCRVEDPPEGPPPAYSLRIYPLLDVAYRFKYHNRSIYVLESEKRALVVQKEQDGWRFLPIFEEEGVLNYVDFRIEGLPAGSHLEIDDQFGQWYVLDAYGERIGGGMAPMATDANNRVLTTSFSLVGDNVIRQTTKLRKTADGKHNVKFPVVTDPWVVVDLDWTSAELEIGMDAGDIDFLYDVIVFDGTPALLAAFCGLVPDVGFILEPVCEELINAALDWLAPYILEIAETDCALASYWEVGIFDNWGYFNDTALIC